MCYTFGFIVDSCPATATKFPGRLRALHQADDDDDVDDVIIATLQYTEQTIEKIDSETSGDFCYYHELRQFRAIREILMRNVGRVTCIKRTVMIILFYVANLLKHTRPIRVAGLYNSTGWKTIH